MIGLLSGAWAEEEKTAGGIIIPDMAKDKPQQGRMVAVGEGAFRDSRIFGFNARTDSCGDLVGEGVIDPTRAVRLALQNASSVPRGCSTARCRSWKGGICHGF